MALYFAATPEEIKQLESGHPVVVELQLKDCFASDGVTNFPVIVQSAALDKTQNTKGVLIQIFKKPKDESVVNPVF